MSPRHQEGLAHLLYGINRGGGFVALTGEVGTGKTTLCRYLLEKLPEDVDLAFILNPKLNAVELLANICDELGIKYSHKNQSLKMFTDLLNTYLLAAHANGRRTVLMIDEAQNLSFEVLEQIRLLTNLETSTTKLLQIVLVGQPELQKLLQCKEMRQLNQRITARYHLEPLTYAETRTYIGHRLTISGGGIETFNDKAIRRIYALSKGIPRLINILCDRSLLGAYATEALTVTPKIVKTAGNEVLPPVAKDKTIRRITFLALLVGTSVSAAMYFYLNPIQAPIKPTTKPAQPIPDTRTGAMQLQFATEIPDTNKVPTKEAILSLKFSDYINNPELTLDTALTKMLEAWDIAPLTGQALDCMAIQRIGYKCLLDQDNWYNILKLNRPAILEFSLPDNEKRYVLLTGTNQGNPVLRFKNDETFKLEEVLAYWQGYFLLFWQPPHPDTNIIFAQQKSADVLWVRQQLDRFDNTNSSNVKQPLIFDNKLQKRVKIFQRLHDLSADGVVGPRTIIHLQNTLETADTPALKIIK